MASWRASRAGPAGTGNGRQDCRELQAKVERLEGELKEARREIRNLKYKLWQIAVFCQEVLDRADPILSKRSGVPRGFWSRVKGRVDIAKRVLARLQ